MSCAFIRSIPVRLAGYSRIKICEAGNKLTGRSVWTRCRDMHGREKRLEDQDQNARFEETIMPHLDAAYNLARWLTRNEHDAQDMVQEAYLRAFRFFGGFRGGDTRAWLLQIVRNTCYTQLQNNRPQELATTFDEEIHSQKSGSMNPETLLLRSRDSQLLRQALEELPVTFREVLVLHE